MSLNNIIIIFLKAIFKNLPSSEPPPTLPQTSLNVFIICSWFGWILRLTKFPVINGVDGGMRPEYITGYNPCDPTLPRKQNKARHNTILKKTMVNRRPESEWFLLKFSEPRSRIYIIGWEMGVVMRTICNKVICTD